MKLSEDIRNWMVAVLTGERLVAHYLGRLRWFKSASDELPPELVQGHYKCRGNRIVGLHATLQAIVEEGISLDDKTIAQIGKYRNYDFDFTRRTTPEEIRFINDTLDKVIENLERLAEKGG